MSKPAEFTIALRSSYAHPSGGMAMGTGDLIRRHKVTCTVAELDDEIARLIPTFDGERYSTLASQLNYDRDRDCITVFVECEAKRKPAGFNTWNNAHCRSNRSWPFPRRRSASA